MSVGRPTKFLPAYCQEVIAVMGEGLSLTAFAGDIGVSRATINNWMEEHPEFLEAVKIGQGKRTAYLERGLLSSDMGPRVTARIFALKNAAPEEWKDKREVEHSGGIDTSSKEQRDAAVAAALRADGK